MQELTLASGYDYGSIQVDLDRSLADRIRDLGRAIPDADLAANGRELRPHITVWYGLTTADEDLVKRALSGVRMLHATLGATAYFATPDADVVYVAVRSPELDALHAHLVDSLPGIETHAIYVPHVTIAYVKPGLGASYVGDETLSGRGTSFDRIVFSPAGDLPDTIIPLGKSYEWTSRYADAIVAASSAHWQEGIERLLEHFDQLDVDRVLGLFGSGADEVDRALAGFDPSEARDDSGRWTDGANPDSFADAYGTGEFFHGGTAEFNHLKSILKDGLRGHFSGAIYPEARPGLTYVTATEKSAEEWAEDKAALAADREPQEGTIQIPLAVLRIQIPKDAAKKIGFDQNFQSDTAPEREFEGTIKPEWITGVKVARKVYPAGLPMQWHILSPEEIAQYRANAEGDFVTLYIPLVFKPQALKTAGGEGSGNFGHAGRPGEVGGSRPAIEAISDRIKKNVEAWREKTGLTREVLAGRVQALYDRATPEQRAAGAAWYPEAHAEAERMALAYGLTPHQAAGVIAALSPLREWSENKADAQTLLKSLVDHTADPAVAKLLQANVAKATEIAKGADPRDVLWSGEGGYKVRSFYSNINDPTGREATIDTHMLRVLLNDHSIRSRDYGSIAGNLGRYDAFRQAIFDVADKAHVPPAAVQATVWLVQKAEHPKRSEVGGRLKAAADQTLDVLLDALDVLYHDEQPLRTAGGEGSGNFHHAGRPGYLGGSAPGTYFRGGGGSDFHLKEILKKGILGSLSGGVFGTISKPGHVYVTENETNAEYWANDKALYSYTAKAEVPIAVLRVEIPPGVPVELDEHFPASSPERQLKGDIKPEWITGVKVKVRRFGGALGDDHDEWRVLSDAELQKLRTNAGGAGTTLYVAIVFPPEELKTAGGAGSGNFGHAGRPGEVGGSAKGVSAATLAAQATALSRTSKGVVDTSSSKDKPGLAAEGQALKDRVANNTLAAAALAGATHEVSSPEQLQTFIENLNKTLNNGLTDQLYRQHEITSYAATPVADIQKELAAFSTELFHRMQDIADPVGTAAWVEWQHNNIHPFSDAVSRTTLLLSNWTLLRAGHALPTYGDRKEYYANASKDLATFTAYYRTLFPPRTAGGQGSGNFHHKGRPGEVGGSQESGRTKLPDRGVMFTSRTLIDYASIGRARKFMYNPDTGLAGFGPKNNSGLDKPTHAEFFHDMGGVGNFDHYVRGKIIGPVSLPSGVTIGAHEISLYDFTGRTTSDDASRDNNQLKTLEYLVKSGAPADTKVSIIHTLWRPEEEPSPIDGSTLGELFPDLYRVKRAAGGMGSGYFGHAGRPGEVGGSAVGFGRPNPFEDTVKIPVPSKLLGRPEIAADGAKTVAHKVSWDHFEIGKMTRRRFAFRPSDNTLILGDANGYEISTGDGNVAAEYTHADMIDQAAGYQVSPDEYDSYLLRGFLGTQDRHFADTSRSAPNGRVQLYGRKMTGLDQVSYDDATAKLITKLKAYGHLTGQTLLERANDGAQFGKPIAETEFASLTAPVRRKRAASDHWTFIINERQGLLNRSAGGQGSGNFAHAGRPGEVGGSAPGKPFAIGYIRKGQIEAKDLGAQDPWQTTHYITFGNRADSGSRFRYKFGTVTWDETPTPDEYFKVEDWLVRHGFPVEHHKVWGERGFLPVPTPEGRAAAGFDSSEPRDDHGQWTSGGSMPEAEHWRKFGKVVSHYVDTYGPDWLREIAKLSQAEFEQQYRQAAGFDPSEPRDDHGQWTDGGGLDHPAVKQFLAKHPAYAPELRAYADAHGVEAMQREIATHVRGDIPSYDFQVQVFDKGLKRQRAEHKKAKRDQGAANKPAIAEQLRQKYGLEEGDTVFDRETGQPGVVKFDVKGQPYIHTRDHGNVLVGSRWQKVKTAAGFDPSEARDPHGRWTTADYHAHAAEANDAAAAAYQHALDQPSEAATQAALAATSIAQTRSGDAGGARARIFKAEDVARKGQFAKARDLHQLQSQFHRQRAEELNRHKRTLAGFDPSEPRDDHGQWTSGGGLSGVASALAKADGGFTYSPVSGQSPTAGYALSLHKDREKVLDAFEATVVELARYAAQNRDLLADPHNYMGGWHNPEDGKVYLDVSTVVETPEEAQRLAAEHDQLAYFDLKAGKSIPTRSAS